MAYKSNKGCVRIFGILYVIILFNCEYAVAKMRHLILVQNSGWMLPFYEDDNSKLKEKVLDIALKIEKYEGTKPYIASFNQSCEGNVSPYLLYPGKESEDIERSIELIQPVMKKGGKVYADTDFVEAITRGINQYSKGEPCILWIITNNKNSPNDSRQTVLRNTEFYNFVNETKEISRVVAVPVPMKVKSTTHQEPEFEANGFMIYAMAYGETAGEHLKVMIDKRVFKEEIIARLKPLNAEALTFIPERVEKSENVSVTRKNRQLLLSFDANDKPEAIVIHGNIVNELYPYDIVYAKVLLRGKMSNNKRINVAISQDIISDMKSGKRIPEIKVRISIPPIPSPWDPEVIFSSGYRATGNLIFYLDNQNLRLSEKFREQMEILFPKDPLPQLFKPGRLSHASVTYQPLLIQVNYPVWPLIIVSALFVIMVAGIIIVFIGYKREKIYVVQVGSMQKRYGLLPFQGKEIMNQYGEPIGKIKRAVIKAEIIKNKEFSGYDIKII